MKKLFKLLKINNTGWQRLWLIIMVPYTIYILGFVYAHIDGAFGHNPDEIILLFYFLYSLLYIIPFLIGWVREGFAKNKELNK